MYQHSLLFIVVAIATVLLGQSWSSPVWAIAGSGSKPEVIADYGRLPLSFEANQGQTADQARFLAQGPGYRVFLTPTETVFALSKPNQVSPGASAAARLQGRQQKPETLQRTSIWTVRMGLSGANSNPMMRGVEALPGKVRRLHGNDPKRWRTDIPIYAKVRLEAVYPGIDLVYYGTQEQLEYDFVVAPSADPGLIRWMFAGARPALATNGDLLLQADTEALRWRKPVLYQWIDGQRREVEGRFVLYPAVNATRAGTDADVQVGFQVAVYDRTQPLIIDPVLVYSTAIGDRSFDSFRDMTMDSAGNVYILGSTDSPDFPVVNAFDATLNGPWDMVVVKLGRNGEMVYATYLGGSDPLPGEDAPYDHASFIKVDSAGNAYVVGTTYSPDFPAVNAFDSSLGGISDGFVAKFDPNGQVVYATFLGGKGEEEIGDSPRDFTVDPSGNVYIVGETDSKDFPMVNAWDSRFGGSTEAFAVKFDPHGQIVYSTYLGGNRSESSPFVAVDQAGNAYVAGVTYSRDFPTVSAFDAKLNDRGGKWYDRYDAFLVKLDADGGAVYATYLGGNRPDGVMDLVVDDAGNAYLAGITSSLDFPTVNAFDPSLTGGDKWDAFLAKFDPQGQAVYSTYLGGSDSEAFLGALRIHVDSAANVYVVGGTRSPDFPTINAFDATFNGAEDLFVAKFDAGGRAIYATYLGGGGSEYSKISFTIDSVGNAYIVGQTDSSDFPTLNAFDASFNGYADSFIAKFDPVGQIVYSTYLGGGDYDRVSSNIAVDSTGSLYVAGTTISADFAWVNALKPCSVLVDEYGIPLVNSFLAKFDPKGQARYITCLGDDQNKYSEKIATDSADNVYVGGYFLKRPQSFDYDIFLLKISD